MSPGHTGRLLFALTHLLPPLLSVVDQATRRRVTHEPKALSQNCFALLKRSEEFCMCA